MTEFVALAAAALAIDGLVWGCAGYLVFRLLGGRKRWWIGIAATAVAGLAQELFVLLPLVRVLDLRLGNEEVADVLGTDRMADLLTFDPLSDVLISVLAIALGFLAAGFLDERRERRAVARAERAR